MDQRYTTIKCVMKKDMFHLSQCGWGPDMRPAAVTPTQELAPQHHSQATTTGRKLTIWDMSDFVMHPNLVGLKLGRSYRDIEPVIDGMGANRRLVSTLIDLTHFERD